MANITVIAQVVASRHTLGKTNVTEKQTKKRRLLLNFNCLNYIPWYSKYTKHNKRICLHCFVHILV